MCEQHQLPGRSPVAHVARFWPFWLVAAPFLLVPHQAPVWTACAALILLAVFLRLRLHSGQTAFDLPLIVYLALSAISFLIAPTHHESLRRLTTLLLGMLGYRALVCYLAAREGQTLSWALGALPFLGTAVALLGLVAARWPDRYFLDLRVVTGSLPHLTGAFYLNHNQLAGMLVLLTLSGIFTWGQIQRAAARLLVALSLLLMLVLLVLTQSRNGLLSLVLGLGGGFLWQRRQGRLLRTAFVLLLVTPLILGALPGMTRAPLGRALDSFDGSSKRGPATDQSWLARLEIWSAAAHMMGDYPVLGAGLYSFEQTSRINEIYETIRPDLSFSHAHNLWLQSGAGMGWPGWLAALLLWLAALTRLATALRTAPPQARWQGVALGATLCGYLSFNAFDLLALEQRAGLVAWLLLALIATFIHRHVPRPRSARLHLAPLILFLLLLPFLPRNLANLQLDRARLAHTAARLPTADALRADARRLGVLYALQEKETVALQIWRLDPRAALFLEGQGLHAFFRRQDPALALRWYERALALAPQAGTVHYWQGAAHEQLGEDEEALIAYRQAVQFGGGQLLFGRSLPALAWEQQGRILSRHAKWEAAAAAFAAAVELEPGVADYHQQLEEVQRVISQMER